MVTEYLRDPAPEMIAGKVVRIAHAYGNSERSLEQALAAPVDIIEADIWYDGGELWVRHERRIGPLPLLVDGRGPASHSAATPGLTFWPGYYIRVDSSRLPLGWLLEKSIGKKRVLLDVKGAWRARTATNFASRLVEEVMASRRWEEVAVCGQNWRVLDSVREQSPLEVRYSIESPRQWSAFLDMLGRGDGATRICMQNRLLNEERAAFLEANSIEVYCWTVDEREEAERLVAEGVDGIISNNLEMLSTL